MHIFTGHLHYALQSWPSQGICPPIHMSWPSKGLSPYVFVYWASQSLHPYILISWPLDRACALMNLYPGHLTSSYMNWRVRADLPTPPLPTIMTLCRARELWFLLLLAAMSRLLRSPSASGRKPPPNSSCDCHHLRETKREKEGGKG